MRLLITGASGLLGLNLALAVSTQQTSASEHSGRQSSLRPSSQNIVFGQINQQPLNTGQFTVIQADLLAPGAVERLLDQAQPDWVIHCAAMAILDACEADPERAFQLNSEIPALLASHVARGGARFLHVSTDAVFDGQIGNYTEADHPNPLNVYARSKLAGERAVAAANPDALIARVNLVGWSLLGKRSLAEFFFYNLQAGKPVKGFTDVYFCPLLANHLAGIFIEMLDLRLSGLYHVVSSQSITKYAYGVQLARRFGFDEALIVPVSVTEGGLKAARSPNLTLCTDKVTASLGHRLPGISAGLDGLFALYQAGYPQMLRSMRWTSKSDNA
jgi:dTDP-4-dehydrorhamnose reductase